jgi:hypothetical protein
MYLQYILDGRLKDKVVPPSKLQIMKRYGAF